MLLVLTLSGLLYLIKDKGKDLLLGLTHPTLIHVCRCVEAKGFDEEKKKPHSPNVFPSFVVYLVYLCSPYFVLFVVYLRLCL